MDAGPLCKLLLRESKLNSVTAHIFGEDSHEGALGRVDWHAPTVAGCILRIYIL